jgi:kynureninase
MNDFSFQQAELHDNNDELSSFALEFMHPTTSTNEKLIYLCGNSLGLQPIKTRESVLEVLDDWARFGVEGHVHANKPWLSFHERVTAGLAHVVGAFPKEVVALNNLTVNLHLLLVSFYRPTIRRWKIAIEENAFPSDVYAVKSQLKYHGFDPDNDLIVFRARTGEDMLHTEDIVKKLEQDGSSIATLLLGGVNYYTGQALNIQTITKIAHKQGIVVGWDLAHAVGNLHLQLHEHGPDFAAWCSYKYLNSGPGGISGIFIHDRHLSRTDLQRFEGWWGTNKLTRFQMSDQFDPIPTAEAWQLSNPSILTLATLETSLDIFQRAGISNLRAKSVKLTAYLEQLILSLNDKRLQIITPLDPLQRGAQLSVRVIGEDRTIQERLVKHGVICDWREPDTIRLAPTPLYNSFSDVWLAVQALKTVLNKSRS